MARKECDYDCKAADDLKELNRFQGKVLVSLENIASSIREMKDDRKIDSGELWQAVSDLRKDLKTMNDKLQSDMKMLYWRIGYIAGGSALVISIVTNLVAGKVGGK